MIIKPVIVHTNIVSKIGPNIPTRPSSVPFLVEDCPWYIGASPTPLSLEKTALLMPIRTNPQKPP